MRKSVSGKVSIITLVGAAALSSLLMAKSLGFVFAGTQPSVTICHSSGSNSNPYIQQSPNIKNDGSLTGGHLNDTGPVWYQGITVVWGDIIPPYSYEDFNYPGLNWNSDGQAFWNNNCNISTQPTATPTLTPTPEPTATLTPTLEPTVTLTPTPEPTATLTPTHEPTATLTPTLEPTPTNVPNDGGDNGDGTPTPTVTPTVDPGVQGASSEYDACTNLPGIQSSVPSGWFQNGANSTECREFQYGGAPESPSTSAGQVLGTSTTSAGSVLGTSTLGATGGFNQDVYLAIMVLGGLLNAFGFKAAKKVKGI